LKTLKLSKLNNSKEKFKNEVILNFGHAYKAFGLSKIMGHVVALLTFSEKPISLEEIADNLGRSKGPISQILKRLRDRNLIRRVWQPNSRKDYYEIQPEIFENAFRNNFDLIQKNTRLAKDLKAIVSEDKRNDYVVFKKRLDQMEKFYEIMEKHFNNFLKEWNSQNRKNKV